jgi:hypothetical protein
MADGMTPLAKNMRKGYIVSITLPSVPSPQGRGDKEGVSYQGRRYKECVFHQGRRNKILRQESFKNQQGRCLWFTD